MAYLKLGIQQYTEVLEILRLNAGSHFILSL